MDAVEVSFEAPIILRLVCYLMGMAVFLTAVLWLRRRVEGQEAGLSLGDSVGLTMMRVLAGCALLSILHMVFFLSPEYPHKYLYPEFSILCLVAALYLLSIKQRPFDWGHIFKSRLPAELVMAVITLVLSAGAWGVSIALGVVLFYLLSLVGAPPWLPIFIIGLAWNAPLILLFNKGQREGRLETFKFHYLLWPVLLAYLFIMIPDIAENVGNDPSIHEMMDDSPPIVRI